MTLKDVECYRYSDISAKQGNDEVTAVLVGTFNGKEYRSDCDGHKLNGDTVPSLSLIPSRIIVTAASQNPKVRRSRESASICLIIVRRRKFTLITTRIILRTQD